MSRRRLLLFGVPVTFVVLGVGGWLVWESMEARTVRPGMTFDEVRRILGDGPNFMSRSGHGERASWHRMDGTITVILDSDFLVTSVQFESVPVFDRVRRWLRL